MSTTPLVLITGVTPQNAEVQSWTQQKAKDADQSVTAIPNTRVWPFHVRKSPGQPVLTSQVLPANIAASIMRLLFLFPAAQADKMNACPGTQQVPAEATELLNLFTGAISKGDRGRRRVVSCLSGRQKQFGCFFSFRKLCLCVVFLRLNMIYAFVNSIQSFLAIVIYSLEVHGCLAFKKSPLPGTANEM